MTRDLVDQMGGPRGREPHRFADEVTEIVDHLTFEMVLHYDNDKQLAVYVSATGDENRAVWLPRKLIKMDPRGRDVPAVKRDGQRVTLPVVTIEMPEWLAKQNRLI